MSVLRSIVLLASVSLAIAFALFIGHALSSKHIMPVIWGLGFLAGAIVLMYLQIRADSRRSR